MIMGKPFDEKHITLTPEAYKRLKLCSARYNLPMKKIVEWFIFSLIDENGDFTLEEPKEVLMEFMPEKLKKNGGLK